MVRAIKRVRAWVVCCLGAAAIVTVSAFIPGQARAADISEPAPPPPPGKALVYVYRAPSFANAASTAEIQIDGVKIAYLRNHQYTWLYVPSDAHTLKLQWTAAFIHTPTMATMFARNDPKAFTWQEGQTYFYRFQAGMETTRINTYRFATFMNVVAKADALAELATYKLVPARNLEQLAPAAERTEGGTPSPSSAPSTSSPAGAYPPH